MKYKVLKGTDLFFDLWSVQDLMKEANASAQKVCDEVGAEGFAGSSHVAAGGIRGFKFKEWMEKKEGWRKLESGFTTWFFPKSSDKSNKELLKRISILPTVSLDAIKNIVKYNTQAVASGDGIAFTTVPGIEWFDDYILVSVLENASYDPLPDMIEITVSEYNKLKKA